MRNEKKDVVFYISHFNNIGGVEQWMYYIAKMYGDRDITVLYKDGVNSERRGADYAVDRFMVNSTDTRSVRMSSGGGFALRLTPVDCNE